MYLRKQVPRNTKRNKANSLRTLCNFVSDRFVSNPSDHPTVRENAARAFMFPGESGGFMPGGASEFSTACLIRVRDVMIEFVTSHRNTRTGAEIKPTTLNNYITSIQRAFKQDWGYYIDLMKGPIFDCPREGLLSALDNKIREQ